MQNMASYIYIYELELFGFAMLNNKLQNNWTTVLSLVDRCV